MKQLIRKRAASSLLASFLVLSTTLVGCSEQVPQEVSSLRTSLLLSEEPTGAITIEEARKLVAENADDIVLILRVGNRNATAWSSKDDAVFFASEGYPDSDYNIGPDHDPSTCPFCKWKWKDEDSIAILKVLKENGDAVPFPAEMIFSFQPEDFVVVKGKGSLDEDGILNVQISGLFKRTTT